MIEHLRTLRKGHVTHDIIHYTMISKTRDKSRGVSGDKSHDGSHDYKDRE